jgi:hypothetical protein
MPEIKNNSAVDLLTGNINDAIGTASWFGEFTFGILFQEDQVVDSILVRDASDVFTSIVLVSESLTALAERLPVCHIGCWHYHVAAKGELSGGGLEGRVEGGVESPLDRSDEVVLDVSKSLERNRHQLERAKLVRNDLVSSLENAVGLGIGRAGNPRSDAIGLEKFLEFQSSEFSSFVMKTDKGSR